MNVYFVILSLFPEFEQTLCLGQNYCFIKLDATESSPPTHLSLGASDPHLLKLYKIH